ncbi:CHAT domain-containing protein [Streptomyces sp. NPDC096324]|uniref:CHAT domain-containing protein n=1 Tax=Streptomyces sp. NPDC096324 TaxID=3366085 RepID=UPI00382EBBCF
MTDLEHSALEAVRARLQRFRAGDASAVLSPEAEQDAARAVERPTPESVAAAAWLHQYRAVAVDDLGGADARLAFQLFAKIEAVLPGELPAHVAAMLRLGSAPENAPARQLQQLLTDAENALDEPVTAGFPQALDAWTDLLSAFGDTAVEEGREHSRLELIGRVLRRRYAFQPDEIWRLEAAADHLRKAIGHVPPHDVLAHSPAYNLGVTLLDHFEATGERRRLREAEEVGARSLRSTSPAHAHYPRLLTHQAEILCIRAGLDASEQAMEEAVRLCRDAIRLVDPRNPAAAFVHLTAARVLSDHYVVSHDLAVLREALASAETAVAGLPDDGEGIPLGRLGRLLMLLGQRTHDLHALERAEEALTSAAEALPYEHSLRAAYLSDLADAQFESHVLTGDEGALRAARRSAQMSLDNTPHGDTAAPAMLDTLARVLVRCYEMFGDPRELDFAVETFRSAEELCPPDSGSRATALMHLGHALQLRAAVLPDVGARRDAFDEAEQVARLAVEAYPPGPDRWMAVIGLAVVLRRRSPDDPADLRRSADLYRSVIGAAAESEDAFLLATFNLGVVLCDLYGIAQQDPALLSEAEQLLRAAGNATPPEHRRHATITAALARCLALRAGAPTREAEELLRAVASPGSGATATDRIAAHMALGRLRADAAQWRPARDAFAEAIDLLAAHLAAGDHAVREHGIASFFGLASQAAACAVAAGDPVDAVHLLERGRGLLMSAGGSGAGDLGTAGRTVAVINVSRYRCDALLVHDGDVTLVPLPEVSHDAVVRQASAFLWGVGRSVDGSSPREERYKGTRVAVNGVLRWLWHTTVRPVLDALPHHSSPGLPRVWWCPTGMLSFLPLHAAGEHSPYDGTAGECAIDRVVSSYTPTLRALRAASKHPSGAASPTPAAPLVIVPDTPGLPTLPQASIELAGLRRLYPNCTAVVGPEATKARIVSELPQHSWVHFAGHGSQNFQVSGSAQLLPHDYAHHGGLGFDALRALDLTHADLAYLSACSTATGQLTLADDQVHVAGTLLAAGFRHVVAAQWTVLDEVAADIAMAFHRQAAAASADGVTPAAALHQAVQSVRAKHSEPHLWAPFMHYGP